MTFAGFPVAALDFYTDSVGAPMTALCEEFAAEFGLAKVFRPYRDVWFSANTPSAARTSLAA